MSDLVHNERVKLLANAIDRALTACLAVGSLAPVVTFVSGAQPNIGPLGVAGLSVSWIAAAIALHLLARRLLGTLRE